MLRKLALSALIAAAVAGPSIAQEDTETMPPEGVDVAPVYWQLAMAKTTDEIWDRSFDGLLEQAKAGFDRFPAFAEAESKCPGFIDTVFESAKPWMREGHYAQRTEFRFGLADIFAKGLTEEQAADAVAYYRSDEARYFLELGTDSASQKGKIDRALNEEEGPIDRETFYEDLDRTHEAIRENADSERLAEAEKNLRASTWFEPYAAIHPQIQELRLKISQSDSTESSEFTTAMNAAIQIAGRKHLESCGIDMSKAGQ